MTEIWHFCELFNFQPMLDNYKIRTRTNFENRESLDPNDVAYPKKIVPASNRIYSAIFNIS